MQLLGLENARNTPIGDEFLRGISGGEKRRVTIATEWVKGSRVLFLGAGCFMILSHGAAIFTWSS